MADGDEGTDAAEGQDGQDGPDGPDGPEGPEGSAEGPEGSASAPEEAAAASDPNFAVVCSFLCTFGPLAQIDPVSVPRLAKMLLDTHEVPAQLGELFSKLLRKALRSFRPNAWEKYLIKFCHQCGHRQEAWELERFGYKKSSIHVKIKILKCLLEYQFVCNNKFKTAVNKLENRSLRLNPVGRDDKGRCYWMHRDHRANIRLYREDQDEETWKLVASDRAGVVDVIAALKSGKSPANSSTEPILNEDSNSVGSPCNPIHDAETDCASKNGSSPTSDKKRIDTCEESNKMDTDDCSSSGDSVSNKPKLEMKDDNSKPAVEELLSLKCLPEHSNTDGAELSLDNQIIGISNSKSFVHKDVSTPTDDKVKVNDSEKSDSTCDDIIEEKVMIIKGEGNGADCEATPIYFNEENEFYFSEEIVEEVMYITGEGNGYDCMTGNPAVETTSSHSESQKKDMNNCELQNSAEEENSDKKLNSDLDSVCSNDTISDNSNCVENISKTSHSEKSDPIFAELSSKSGIEPLEDMDQDLDVKNNQSAPLPVTKRFLQNIPKLDGEVSDSNKSKIWSVDSMCGNTITESLMTEKNSISESNEAVLLNKNSLNDIDNKTDAKKTEGSSDMRGNDLNDVKLNQISTIFNTNGDKVISNDVKSIEKVSEQSTPKKFFFGQPGCLKLSPDLSTLSPNTSTSIKEMVVSNEVKQSSPNVKEICEKVLAIDKSNNVIDDLNENKIVNEKSETPDPSNELLKNEIVENVEELSTKPVKAGQSVEFIKDVEESSIKSIKEIDESSSNFVDNVEKSVTDENVDLCKNDLVANVEVNMSCEIPSVPENSVMDSEDLMKNKISDVEMSVLSEKNNQSVSEVTTVTVQPGKHKAECDSVSNDVSTDSELSTVKKIKLSTSDNIVTNNTSIIVEATIGEKNKETNFNDSVLNNTEVIDTICKTVKSTDHTVVNEISAGNESVSEKDVLNDISTETESPVCKKIKLSDENDLISKTVTMETEFKVSENIELSNENLVPSQISSEIGSKVCEKIDIPADSDDSVLNKVTPKTENTLTVQDNDNSTLNQAMQESEFCKNNKLTNDNPPQNDVIAETESALEEKTKLINVDSVQTEINIETEPMANEKIKLSNCEDSVLSDVNIKTESTSNELYKSSNLIGSVSNEITTETKSLDEESLRLSSEDNCNLNNVHVDHEKEDIPILGNEYVNPAAETDEPHIENENVSEKTFSDISNLCEIELPEIDKSNKKTESFICKSNLEENVTDATDVNKLNGASGDISVLNNASEVPVASVNSENSPDSKINDLHDNTVHTTETEIEKFSTKIVKSSNRKNTRSASSRKNILAYDDTLKKDVDESIEEICSETIEEKPKKGKSVNTRKRAREESGSMSEEEDIKSNKKSKLKQKKTNIAQRKKVEEKKLETNLSSDEEPEEPLVKATKKSKGKSKNTEKKESKKEDIKRKRGSKSNAIDEDLILSKDDDPPIRQSRRIAQLKIKEEAQRRLMEEVALRELKEKHKKKNSKGHVDQDWKHSSEEHSSDNEIPQKGKGKMKKDKKLQKIPLKWNSNSSGGNETDTEPGEEPEDDFDEPDDEDILVVKSDHEFSPESDVEDDEWTPVRRARTLKKDDDDGDVSGGCVYCGKSDHPEWILLCDSCDAGWHASCLKPVLFLVPEGEWFCPPCNHKSLIDALEKQLEEYDEQIKTIELEDLHASKESLNKEDSSDSEFHESGEKSEKSDDSDVSGSTGSSSNSSDDEKIYRLRERRQLPISYRFKEYDQLISSAIKEEYKEDENSGAGNQGRGKDISTIIEAEKEEKKAMLQAAGGDEKEIAANLRKISARARRRPRKLNSLEVLSDDADDNSDEDFKEAGWSSSSSEAITSEPDGSSSSSHSSDSMPLRRPQRKVQTDKSRRRIIDSPEIKKKSRRILDDDTTEPSDEEKESTPKKKKSSNSTRSTDKKSSKRKKKNRNRKDCDDGEVGGDSKAKVKIKYGGLSDSSKESHDWSPAHRTRQRKYNYMEMPNTESEEEAHKPSGKHMDSSDEYKGESDSCSDSDSSRERNKRKLKLDEDSQDDYQKKMNAAAVSDILKGSLVPIVKLSDISPIKSDNNLQKDENSEVRNILDSEKLENANHLDQSLSKKESACLPVKNLTPLQMEREKKRKEKQEKLLEKEKRKEERIKKKEEKIQLKEQKAKEREEKKLARLANKEQSKINKRPKSDFIGGSANLAVPIPIMNSMPRNASPMGVQFPLPPGHPPGTFDIRGHPPRNMTPIQMKMDHPNPSPIQDFANSPNPSKLQEHLLYRSQLNMSPHMRHSESPNISEPSGYLEDRKGMPVDHRLPMFPGDIRKPPAIPGSRPNYVGQRILPLDVDNPARHLPPGYNPSNPVPPPDDMSSRSAMNPVAGLNMHKNGVPIADMTMGNMNLPRHLSPTQLGALPGLENNPMAGPRGTTPKRRGRGPGKKTLARQAAAAASGIGSAGTMNLPEGSSPGPMPSNSPLPEGTLTVAGAPQPFRPIVDPPSIITRMPHMMPPPYRGSSMYGNNSPMYGPPRGASPNIPMPGAYRPLPPHPLDPSPSGGGPISMASPGRHSPHGHPYPYQSPSYYPPASTPPQLGPHGSPYAPPSVRFPPPHISAPPSISPASTNTQDSMEMDDKSKVFQDQPDHGPFLPNKPEIKQEPESLSIKQSTSPTDELEETPTSEDQAEVSDEPSNVGPTITTSPRAHPQIKHTENKGEKTLRTRIAHTIAARYPQGPYAPQYGPYPPYPVPPASDIPYLHPSMHVIHPNIPNPQPLTPIHRQPISNPHHIPPVPMLQRPPLMPVDHLRQDISVVPPPPNVPNVNPIGVQNEEEAGEFGGLVSYFSSQQEDDIDT